MLRGCLLTDIGQHIAEDIMDRIYDDSISQIPPTSRARGERNSPRLLGYARTFSFEDGARYYALRHLWGDCPAVPIDVDGGGPRSHCS